MENKESKENTAKVEGRLLPISTKQAIEICNFIRGKEVDNAKKILERVIKKEVAIPFKRFNMDMGHKRKIGPGRYPKKASGEIIGLLESVNSNAQFKGLSTSNLIIKKICANKASSSWHFGRKRRRKMKRTNIEIVVEEGKAKEDMKEKASKLKIKKIPSKKPVIKEQKTKETEDKK